ncbi:MAG: NAD(P)-dependent oxidoreductase [Bacteroidota bacterium]
MNVAITGANGFLGSYLTQEFLEAGFTVIALVRKSANCESLSKHPSLHIEAIDYKSNLTDQFLSLRKKYGKLTYMIHNAGVTVSLSSMEYFLVNTKLTQNLIGALEKSEWLPKENKLIYVSSMAAQGPFGIDKPVSNYGRSKKDAEEIIRKGLFPFLMFRPTGVYGARDIAFLPLFKLANRGLYPLMSSEQKMSMIHAKDLARIIREEAYKSVGIIHANDGNTYFHKDFIEALKQVTGKKIKKLPISPLVSKISLGLSDLLHRSLKRRPGLTLEKFQEISMDWHLHENPNLLFSNIPCNISLEEGFKDTYHYYKTKSML